MRDAELLDEQIEYYRADAESFDQWLSQLLDDENDDPVARTYRAGRELVGRAFAQRAPLGRVLEIAAGGGRLAGLYAPHARAVLLLDASPESLMLARHRLGSADGIDIVEADVFGWEPDGRFDTIVFSAWLHHVPHSRFPDFWRKVGTLLGDGGRVIFDFPDARLPPPGAVELPADPSQDHRLYVPVDGISTRDHFGRRWRVVHNRWDPGDLSSTLHGLGWRMDILGPGLFNDVVWAEATR